MTGEALFLEIKHKELKVVINNSATALASAMSLHENVVNVPLNTMD